MPPSRKIFSALLILPKDMGTNQLGLIVPPHCFRVHYHNSDLELELKHANHYDKVVLVADTRPSELAENIEFFTREQLPQAKAAIDAIVAQSRSVLKR